MEMITCVAWKANKVSDGSRLLVLIKNHRQLNCGAVVLCWPVIASESGSEIVRATAADIATQLLAHAPIKSGLCKLSFPSSLSRRNETSLKVESLILYFDRWNPLGWNVTWTHSVLYAPESQVRHLRILGALRLFCHICISWNKPLLKCTSAELCISELIMLICNSLQALNNM